jgi:hypothetical protein
MSTLYPDEAGRLRLDSEWPRSWGLLSRTVQDFPDVIDSSNATGFRFRISAESIASQITVQYQGVSVFYKDSQREADLGFSKSRTVQMPYCLFQRQAAWAARYIYEMMSGYIDVVQFRTSGVGLLTQLNDRIRVQTDQDDSPVIYRVSSKRWSRDYITIEATREHHSSSITDATLATEGSTSYGSSSELCL